LKNEEEVEELASRQNELKHVRTIRRDLLHQLLKDSKLRNEKRKRRQWGDVEGE